MICGCFRRVFVPLLTVAALFPASAELRVPGFTAYLDPLSDGARVSSRSGITRWRDRSVKVVWYGEFKKPGKIDCSIEVGPGKGENRLRLSVGGKSAERVCAGTNVASFGSLEIPEPGYQRFVLELLSDSGESPGLEVKALLLDGPALEGAHFNLEPRRNAASVHLSYDTGKRTNISAFYCEVTAVEDPVWTFYMACGWHRGYFGMQVNSPTERRIIFSVWDSGNEGVDRNKVAAENRVNLVGKGEGVYTGDFGNEGTGGHSHLKYMWKTGEKQRFLVTAKPDDATHTTYSGYYFHPEKKEWFLISSWRAPKEGGYMRGLHSFSENFVGDNGNVVRKALYGNQWMRTADGPWIEVAGASFSHDATGRADRLDRFMGVENGQFFLSHGGFVPGFTKFGEKFARPVVGGPPTDLEPAR